jgi:hypothetical protein
LNRRELLRAVGGAAALSFVPRGAQGAWLRVASGRPPAGGLSEQQLALVGAVADTIIPRTDTPGATDVGVPAWVNVIFAEYYTDAERASFVAGLEAIDAEARSQGLDSFVSLPADAQGARLAAFDRPADRQAPAARAFARLKGLVVHGYFTSERVHKEVLKVEIMPGRFDGAAPMPTRGSR